MRAKTFVTVTNLDSQAADDFVGRKGWLEQLEHGFAGRSALSRIQILVGPGGIGKTALAQAYAIGQTARYGVIWIIRAGNAESLTADLLALASRLSSHAAPSSDPNDQPTLEDFRRAVAQRDDVLLIFDGAPTARRALDSLPPDFPGHTIITTRDTSPVPSGQIRALDTLERADAVALLSKRLGWSLGTSSVKELCTAMGDFPLALVQAAVFMGETGLSPAEYLRTFERYWGELFREHPVGDGSIAEPLRMSAELTIRRIEGSDPLTADILNVAAYLHPQGISNDLLLAACTYAGRGRLKSLAGDPVELQERAGTLVKFALFERRGNKYFASDLITAAARDRLSTEQQTYFAGLALRTADATFHVSDRDLTTWQSSAEHMPHALEAARHCHLLAIFPTRAAELLNRCGEVIFRRGRYAEAKLVFEEALREADRDTSGKRHPSYWAIRNNIGRALNKLQDTVVAIQSYKALLVMEEAAHGKEDPRLTETLNNLGLAYSLAGNLQAAHAEFSRAYSLCLNSRQPDEARRARILNNLGNTQLWQGNLEEAAPLLDSAFAIATHELGDNHPDVACVLVNLAEMMRRRGNLTMARHNVERALKIDTAAYGANHPDVARDLACMAQVMLTLKDFPRAELLLARAMGIDERCLAPNHPTVERRRKDAQKVRAVRQRQAV